MQRIQQLVETVAAGCLGGAVRGLNGLSVEQRPAGDLKDAVARDGTPVWRRVVRT